jgi:dienelactone hydrolase
MLESPYFAAVAVHAGSWRHPDECRAIKFAQRKIPLNIIIGDEDEFFTMASVNNTRDALEKAGFPIEVTVIPGQHHGFNPADAPEIEHDAWTFLSSHSLDGPPGFVTYR